MARPLRIEFAGKKGDRFIFPLYPFGEKRGQIYFPLPPMMLVEGHSAFFFMQRSRHHLAREVRGKQFQAKKGTDLFSYRP